MQRLLLLLAFLSPVLSATGQDLITDNWEGLSTKSSYQDLVHWDILNPDGKLEVVKTKEGLAVRLSQGMKLRSHGVAPYTESTTLKWTLTTLDEKSAGGAGLIDFQSGLYFYLYTDREKKELVLQRGDGLTTHQLFRQEFDPGSDSHSYELDIKMPENRQPIFAIRIDGKTVGENIADPSNLELGSTYQLYIGVGNESVVDIHETTAIRAPKSREGSGWWIFK